MSVKYKRYIWKFSHAQPLLQARQAAGALARSIVLSGKKGTNGWKTVRRNKNKLKKEARYLFL
jgi:hypothetical protein